MEYDKKGFKDHAYWKLEAKAHKDSKEDTIEHTRWLIHDAVEMQMLSDISISTFLSGGVDSSLVTAICAKKLQKEGKNLNTFSFDFVNNQDVYKRQANAHGFIERMPEGYDTIITEGGGNLSQGDVYKRQLKNMDIVFASWIQKELMQILRMIMQQFQKR